MISKQRRKLLVGAAAVAAASPFGLQNAAFAQVKKQDFSGRQIRLIVPLSAGSSVDVIARAMSPKLSGDLKQSIYVDNRPGGDSIVATEVTRSARPDGQTVLLVTPSHAINNFLHPDLDYDPIKDFTMIGLAASNVNVLMVPQNSPCKTLKDLVDLAKASPGKLNYGNSGGTSGGAAELLNLYAGIKTNNILYRGAVEATSDMLGGRLDFIFSAISTALPFVRNGNLRGIAVTSAKRHPSLPNLPTVAESYPGYEVLGWYGLIGPKGIPPDLVNQLNHALNDAITTPSVMSLLKTNGIDTATPGTPAQFTQYVESEVKKWKQVTKPVGT